MKQHPGIKVLEEELQGIKEQWVKGEISDKEFHKKSEDILELIDQLKTIRGGKRMGIMKKAVIGGVLFLGIAGCTAAISDKAPEVKKVEEKESAVPILQPAEPKKEEPKEERPSSAPKNDGITQENFDRIVEGNIRTGEGGTTIDAVQAMIATEPLTKIEADVMGIKTVTYNWTHFETGSMITVTFINGKAVSKAFDMN